MQVRQGNCRLCGVPFTAYGGDGCAVVRLGPNARRGACQMAGTSGDARACPALRATAGVSVTNEPAPVPSRPRLSEQDRKVLSALTREFATTTDIAVRARIPTRSRAEVAEEICVRLARYGLAEGARNRARSLWRLRWA